MRLVVNGRFLRVRPTGMQRAARILLTTLRDSGARLTVVAPRGVDDPLVDRHAPGPPGRFGDALWEQTVLPALTRGDVVFSPVNLAPVAAGRGIVWTHDLAATVGPQWFRGWQSPVYARLALAAARRAERVFVPTAAVGAELSDIAGVDPAVVRVLRLPVDPAFRPAPPDDVDRLRQRLGLHRPYVVHLGCHDPRKDAAFAVRAHLAAASDRPHDLVLAGRPHPIFTPVELPTAPSVRAVGYVADDDLPALLTGAAALVSPSRYEGFGLPPLEAMACGTPALVSDLPVHRESTWERAELLPLDDVDAWAAAIVRALDGECPVGPLPSWSAADQARDFLAGLPDDVRAVVSP